MYTYTPNKSTRREITLALQNYLLLQNGTDVRGVACEGIPGEKVTLSEEAAENIAKAFCVCLLSRTGETRVTVAVGYDSRITANSLCNAVANGILSSGHNAVLTGLSTTPSMFMLLQEQSAGVVCQGSIMITASHLPFNRNGFKFFTPQGGLEKADVTEILTLAASYRFSTGLVGEKIPYNYLDIYANTLVERVRKATGEEKPLLGKKIVVDAGNGAGGFFADKVLSPLGANTDGSQFLEPDGLFPNHIPNPEDSEAMQFVCSAVKQAKADFGIIFDTDVDRASAVDKFGNEINRNKLIALIAAILLEEKPGTIVTDSITSDGLSKFIEAKGGRHHRFKRGYKNVINEAIRLNELGEYTPLAIETSGHAAFKENYFLDDGAYLITRLLIALARASKEGKEITDYVKDLEMPAESLEIRLKFASGCDFKTLGQALLKDFENFAQGLPYAEVIKNNYEGCRVALNKNFGDGWALVRMSLHDPVLPINVESNTPHGCLKSLKVLYRFLQKYPFLDVAPLHAAITLRREALLEDVKKAKAEGKLTFIFGK